MPPNSWWDAVYTCCFVILNMHYGFNHLFDGRMFIKLLFERKLMSVMDGRNLPSEMSTEEPLNVLRSAMNDGDIVSEEVLSIRIA